MKKKIIASILLLTFISLAVFVAAWEGEVNFNFNKGWNLVYGLGDINQLEGQVLTESSIKAIYGFIPTTQEYVQVYPEVDFSKINLIDDDELMNTAFWVYSDEEISSEYWLAEEIIPLKDRPIYDGWNFVGITPDMIKSQENPDLTFDEIKGNCNIEKAYHWNNLIYSGHNEPSWETIYGESEMDSTLLGKGIVIKVSSNCNLGTSDSTGTGPPGLPIPTENDFPEKIGEYTLIEVRTTGPNADYECDSIENHPDTSWTNLTGEICGQGISIKYSNPDNKGNFITLRKIEKGKELLKRYFEIASYEEIIIDGKTIIKTEPGQFTWLISGDYDQIFSSEYVIKEGGTSVTYPPSSGNEVTKYFINKYPPLS